MGSNLMDMSNEELLAAAKKPGGIPVGNIDASTSGSNNLMPVTEGTVLTHSLHPATSDNSENKQN